VPGRYLETFLVGSWEEHQRQHARATENDVALLEQIDGLLASGTSRTARHYLAVPDRRREGTRGP
jgi:Transmembrane secretion effector